MDCSDGATDKTSDKANLPAASSSAAAESGGADSAGTAPVADAGGGERHDRDAAALASGSNADASLANGLSSRAEASRDSTLSERTPAACTESAVGAVDPGFADPLLHGDDAECQSDDGTDDVTDALVKGVFDPDDNLPKPKRFRTRSRGPTTRSRAGSKLSSSAGSNSDVASSTFGSHLSFKRPLPSRQASTMSRMSRTSGVSGISAKSGISMLSRASGTSVMSQLTAHESCGFLHIANDMSSMLGSAILLTSPSYLDVYQGSYLNLADQLQLPVDSEMSLPSPQDGHIAGGLSKIAEEPEDIESIAQAERHAAMTARAAAAATAASAAVSVEQSRSAATVTDDKVPPPLDIKTVRSACYRRVVSMALTFFFVYSSFFSLRNVQSSLAKDPSLGLLTLGCLYALPWLGAVCSYPIMHRIRPKWTMVCATLPYLLFALSNFHAVAYLALPASLIQGFGLGLIWAAEGLYMVNTASTYSIVSDLPLNQAIGKFNSVFYAIYQSSNVVGNGLSSLILQSVFPGEELTASTSATASQLPTLAMATSTDGLTSSTAESPASNTWITAGAYSVNDSGTAVLTALLSTNATALLCGIEFDYSQKLSASSITPAQKYTLLSVMTVMAISGSLVSIFLVKKLDVAHLTGARNVFVSFRNMLKIIIDPRMVLLFPVFIYFGFSGSLMFGDYAKAFISCRYGASKIGLVFLVGAAVGVLGSLTSGIIASYTGRAPVILVAGLVATGAYITILFWTPPDGGVTLVLFVPVVMWCFSDGILSSQINGFQGFIFQEKLPSACAAYLLCYGCSVAIGTMTAAFEWITLQTKTYMVICMQVTALTSYIFIEGLLRRGVLKQG